MYENGKTRPVESTSGVGGEGIKRMMMGGEFNCDTL
jgi:hypothetical protein